MGNLGRSTKTLLGAVGPKEYRPGLEPPQVDLPSFALRQSAENERRRLTGSRGTRSTFLSGALGDQGGVSTSVRRMIGG